MQCSKSILQAMRNEFEAVGISLKGVSDKEIQEQINANAEQFKAVGYNDEVTGNIDQLAEAYNRSRKKK